MRYGIPFEQGEIVLIPFPFTDLKTKKKRPVLVLSNKDYNKKTLDFICCGITSNIKDTEFSVLIDSKDLKSGFLPKPSRIKVDKIFTLEQSLVVKRFAKVKEYVMKKVKSELFKLFE
jgi:mRNA interferase MazF